MANYFIKKSKNGVWVLVTYHHWINELKTKALNNGISDEDKIDFGYVTIYLYRGGAYSSAIKEERMAEEKFDQFIINDLGINEIVSDDWTEGMCYDASKNYKTRKELLASYHLIMKKIQELKIAPRVFIHLKGFCPKCSMDEEPVSYCSWCGSEIIKPKWNNYEGWSGIELDTTNFEKGVAVIEQMNRN